jgi:hypothetical protein
MRYRLPPMNALKVFEAAGRHLSFKAAAGELRITPSAVSHGVQTLEEWLGQPLFARRREGLALTRTGAIYFPAARQALQGLAEGIEALPGARARGKLTISAAPTFAARILLPHLHKLRQGLPDVSVQIDTAANLVDFRAVRCRPSDPSRHGRLGRAGVDPSAHRNPGAGLLAGAQGAPRGDVGPCAGAADPSQRREPGLAGMAGGHRPGENRSRRGLQG